MVDEGTPDAPVPLPEAASEGSKLLRAANMAAALLRRKEMLVAALEILRDRQVLSQDEQVKLFSAYEQGSTVARSAIQDMVEKLQQANLGRVVVSLAEQVKLEDIATGAKAAGPAMEAMRDQVRQEAKPYIERAKQRLVELKALEEPTLRRLEAVTANLADAGREVAKGLKGVGKEAADELIRRGKSWYMSAETEELEREFFDWALRNLPKAERGFVQFLVGSGILLFVTGILIAAQEFGLLEQFAQYAAIFVLLFLGLVMLNWGIKFKESMKSGRSEIENLARMSPAERRVFLARRWTARAEAEGLIDSEEARTVIEDTLRAMPEPGVEALAKQAQLSEPPSAKVP